MSDASATIARPWETIAAAATPGHSADLVAARIAAWQADVGEAFAAIVVGLPRRLNGEDTTETQPTRLFAARLAEQSGLAVHFQDERLTSHAADERLKVRERDWRARKKRLDAEAAAIILQDFLDSAEWAREATTS
jgi:putative transcription antitermination factor YqgF